MSNPKAYRSATKHIAKETSDVGYSSSSDAMVEKPHRSEYNGWPKKCYYCVPIVRRKSPEYYIHITFF